MVLLYKAATKKGKIVHGLIEARDIPEAVKYLRAHDLVPITIEPQGEMLFSKLLTIGNRFNHTDLVFFTRQVASMLTSGLTLMQALHVLKDQMKKKAASDVVNKLIGEIETGNSLSQAMEQYPQIFSSIYVSLIKAGESSGLLDKVMTRLADNLEKELELRRKIKSALFYPIIVIVMMVIVVFIMMLFVIPQLNTLYQSLSIDLPFSTRVLVGLSNFMVSFWYVVIIVFVGSLVLFRRWYKTKRGRRLTDMLVLRVPIFGNLLRLQLLTEFSRTLGLLLGSGEPVVGSIQEAKDVVGNVVYEEALARVAKQVEKGVTMGDALNDSPLFPPMIIQMVKVGEQTGKLDENLARASDYFQREVEESIKTLTTALEPIIMAILGIGVAFLLIAVITPIYKLTTAF